MSIRATHATLHAARAVPLVLSIFSAIVRTV